MSETITTWSREKQTSTPESFGVHVKLSASQWVTEGGQPGYDKGGKLNLIEPIFKAIKEHGSFNEFIVARRAVNTMFLPEIVLANEILPDHMTTAAAIGAIGQGTQYDMYISFKTKDEATLFKLTFRGGVDIGFAGD